MEADESAPSQVGMPVDSTVRGRVEMFANGMELSNFVFSRKGEGVWTMFGLRETLALLGFLLIYAAPVIVFASLLWDLTTWIMSRIRERAKKLLPEWLNNSR